MNSNLSWTVVPKERECARLVNSLQGGAGSLYTVLEFSPWSRPCVISLFGDFFFFAKDFVGSLRGGDCSCYTI